MEASLETPSRREVWFAISDLFLDQQLDDDWIRSIAHKLAESGFDWAELDSIYRYEVAPFLCPFPYPAIGPWTEFDRDWVCAEARKRLGRHGPWARLRSRLGVHTKLTDSDWERVRACFELDRSEPATPADGRTG